MSGTVTANIGASSGLVQAPAGVPSGLIAFVTGSCPTGWTEYTAARGRSIVGTPSGGTGEGTQGTALSNQEDRAVGQHNHSFSGSALGTHTHTFSGSAHDHEFAGSELGTHGHTFSGSGMGTHNHTQASHGHTMLSVQNYGNTDVVTNAVFIAAAPVGGAYMWSNAASNASSTRPIQATTPTNNAAGAGTPAGTNATITAGTPAGDIDNATAAGTNAAITAGTPAGTIANSGSVASTNAPYIQLTCCKKD